MWHRVAPLLARDFTIVAPDLRGYGDSSKPPTSADHAPYSKRAMANDQVALMQHFGFQQFGVAGHDRGGRVAYRLALDHPRSVVKVAVLDIIPTGEAFRRADMRFGLGYWHWFFLAQPAPFPEELIGANPDAYYFRDRTVFAEEALADYLRYTIRPPFTRCARTTAPGATFDFALDEADRGVRRIQSPLLALWGATRSARALVRRAWDLARLGGRRRGRRSTAATTWPRRAPEATAAELRQFMML